MFPQKTRPQFPNREAISPWWRSAQKGCPRARVERMAHPLEARVVLFVVALDALVASFPHPPSPQLQARLPQLPPRTTRIRMRGLSPVTVLQALVDDVSAYQDRYAFLGARAGRPAAPAGMKKAVTDAMSSLGDAWKAMDKSVKGLRINLPQNQNQGMPKPDGSEERAQFSTWAQPNWWNRAPKWLDELPWWLEGYLQRKAMKGDLKGKEDPLVEDQRQLERTSHRHAHR